MPTGQNEVGHPLPQAHRLREPFFLLGTCSTTGASPLDAAKAAQEAGATVVGVATIADRATGAAAVFADAGLEYRHAYGLTDLGLA